VIKIDIEGAEVVALRGAESVMTAAGTRPVLLVAVHPQFLPEFGCTPRQLTELARQRRFRTFDMQGQAADPVEYAEYLWVPEENVDCARKIFASSRSASL
jgi:hypothetical protein